MDNVIDKRGYLNTEFMLFHLSDRRNDEHTFHYHEFDKIVVLLSGRCSYIIEGKEYYLSKGDVLLVNHHDIHKPIIDSDVDYNRIVIWLNRDLIGKLGQGTDLSLAFRISRERSMSLLKVPEAFSGALMESLEGLEAEQSSEEYGAHACALAYLTRCLTLINRIAILDTEYDSSLLCRYDAKIDEVIRYINSSLTEDLSLEAISSRFFISKSYLMHRFRLETGYTLHNYVLQKRLFHARHLLKEGIPVSEAAEQSGFSEYTTFLRAFKKQFKCLPKDF